MKKILLIDDDPATRIAVEQSFAADFEVTSRPCGEGLLEVITQVTPDLLLLDIHLPGQSGLQLLGKVKEKHPTLAVFMLTVRGDEDTILKCFKSGCEDYITKPFSIAVLKARISRWIPTNITNTTTLGDFIYDEKSGKLQNNKVVHQLNSKEQLVLTFLIKNSNMIVSRQQIINFAWGYDYYGTSITVDNVISCLIKKLNDNSNKEEIITSHRKLGYRINL